MKHWRRRRRIIVAREEKSANWSCCVVYCKEKNRGGEDAYMGDFIGYCVKSFDALIYSYIDNNFFSVSPFEIV